MHACRSLLASLCIAIILSACSSGGEEETRLLQISGNLRITEFSQVDADPADPRGRRLESDNNSASRAQFISNPAIVGGYVSGISGNYPVIFEGESGNPYPTDREDWYRVILLADQYLSLSVYSAQDAIGEEAAPSVAVDVVLRRATTGQVVIQETGVSRLFQTGVPESGEYLLQIRNSAAPATYILRTSDQPPVAVAVQEHSKRPNPKLDFVPGQALVRFAEESDAKRQAATAQTARRVYALDPANDSYLVELIPDQRGAFSARSLDEWTQDETLAAIDRLRSRPDVLWAEPNYIRRLHTEGNRFFELQWNVPQIKLPAAWETGISGENAIVAVIDTGILFDHPDLQGQTLPGFDFISNPEVSRDGDGMDTDATDPGDDAQGGSSFHGTHVASIVAAANNTEGVVGVAYDSRIMPLRVLGEDGQGTDSDLVAAIRYAAGLSNASGRLPDQRADVINMSLGGEGSSRALEEAINDAAEAGLILIAAAGNEQTTEPTFPAAYPNVVSVSALDAGDALAWYSNRGPTIDIAAPGGDLTADLTGDGNPDGILGAWADDLNEDTPRLSYAFFQGTSMAAPHVAGVAALMVSQRRSAGNELTGEEFLASLRQGALSELPAGRTAPDPDFGYGILDAARALTAVGAEPFPTLTSSENNFLFTASGSQSLQLTIPSVGVEIISVSTEVDDGGSWLQVTDAEDALPQTWRIQVDASELASGVVYQGQINFSYVASNTGGQLDRQLSLSVTVSLPTREAVVSAGRHYFILEATEPYLPECQPPAVTNLDNPEPLTPCYHIGEADAENGSYTYAINSIPLRQGQGYLLSAGSDLDNDGFICEPGESCGLYPLRNRPEVLEVNATRSGLDFSTGFGDSVTREESREVVGARILQREIKRSLPLRRHPTGRLSHPPIE